MVEETPTGLVLHVAVNIFHSTQAAPGAKAPDTIRYLFDEKSSHKLCNQFEQHLGQHRWIVALSEVLVKAGKCDSNTSRATYAAVASEPYTK